LTVGCFADNDLGFSVGHGVGSIGKKGTRKWFFTSRSLCDGAKLLFSSNFNMKIAPKRLVRSTAEGPPNAPKNTMFR
jgi:hypothetical protein